MKNVINTVLAAATLAFATAASATPIVEDYAVGQIIDTTHPMEYTFNITDGANPFQPKFDKIDTLTVSYTLNDDGGSERYTVVLSGSASAWKTGMNLSNGNNNGNTLFSFDVNSGVWFDKLNETGFLTMKIAATEGSFQFISASLRGTFTEGVPPAQVPEPFSLALLGVGMAGLAASRRRKA